MVRDRNWSLPEPRLAVARSAQAGRLSHEVEGASVVVVVVCVDVVVAEYADGASAWTSHHVATSPGLTAVIDREELPPIGATVVAASGVVVAGVVVAAAAAGRVVAAAGRVAAAAGRVAAAAGRVAAAAGRVAAAAGRVVAAAGRVVAAAGRVVAAAPAALPTAHFTAVLTTQVSGRFAATSPTVTWPGE